MPYYRMTQVLYLFHTNQTQQITTKHSFLAPHMTYNRSNDSVLYLYNTHQTQQNPPKHLKMAHWHIIEDMTQCYIQGCGSGLIYYGSGSSIFYQFGAGSGSKLKQNFRRQFLSQICLKSKFESNQIKNTCVIHQKNFQEVPVPVVIAILYLFSGKIFVKNN
jgi:hypothetical protein